MKNFKFSHLFLAIVGVLSFAACQHEFADWTPGEADKNMGVYFPSVDVYEVSATDTFVEIPVKRTKIDEAAEVSFRFDDLTLEDDSESLFSVESRNITFDATVDPENPQDTSCIKILFDGSKLVVGQEYPIYVKLDEAESSNYGLSAATFTIMIPEPWYPYGETAEASTGIYFDDFLAGMFDDPTPFQGVGTYVKFERSGLNPNIIRTVDLFSKESLAAMWGGLPDWLTFTTEGHTYVKFDISDPNNVIMLGDYQDLGNDQGLRFTPIHINLQGYDLVLGQYVVEGETEPIKLENGIIKFPTDASIVLGALQGGQYVGYFYEANPTGYMQLYLPGTEFVDYSMSVTYDGMMVNGETAKAVFSFLTGTDVASFKFAFAEGDVTADPSEAIAAIVEGAEGWNIYESVEDTLTYEVELTRGAQTLVAVPYTAEGEPRVEDAINTYLYFYGKEPSPEVAAQLEVGAPAQLVDAEDAEATEAKSPACFNIGIKLTADGSLLRFIKVAVVTPEVAAKKTNDEIFAAYGIDASDWIADIKENGSVVGSVNVVSGTTAKVYVRFSTIYTTEFDVVADEPYTLPEYDGDFAIGDYKITEGENSAVFNVSPAKSYTSFLWTGTDGISWYADYNAETSLFTIDGMIYGMESAAAANNLSSFYGMVLTTSETEGFSYFSTAEAESMEQCPTQIQVGANGLEKLLTYYSALNCEYQEGKWIGVSAMFQFTPEATIAPYVAEEETPEGGEDTPAEGEETPEGGEDTPEGGEDTPAEGEETPETGDEVEVPAEPSALSVTAKDLSSYSVAAAERVEIVKPYYGEVKRSFAPATLKR